MMKILSRLGKILNKLFNFSPAITRQVDGLRPVPSAEQAVMNAFGLERDMAEWLIDALKIEGYEVRKISEML